MFGCLDIIIGLKSYSIYFFYLFFFSGSYLASIVDSDRGNSNKRFANAISPTTPNSNGGIGLSR